MRSLCDLLRRADPEIEGAHTPYDEGLEGCVEVVMGFEGKVEGRQGHDRSVPYPPAGALA